MLSKLSKCSKKLIPAIHQNLNKISFVNNDNKKQNKFSKFKRNYIMSDGVAESTSIFSSLSSFVYMTSLTLMTLGASSIWLASRYRVAAANEYLVRTGIFIEDIDISKKAFWLPYQTLTKILLEPKTIHCVIEAMSHERISFNMPTVFTVGPKDDKDALKIYAKLLQKSTPEDFEHKIRGIIQGETRMAAGKLPLDDLFNNRPHFKEQIVDKINLQLADFGLVIYNANIEELRDMKGNEYFVFLRKKALECAVNDAKVAVAEQTKKGNLGESRHLTETRQQLAEYEKQAKLTENDRTKDIEESGTNLDVAKWEFSRQSSVAEAKAASEKRKLELQKEVEEYRNRQVLEQLRASQFTAANVSAEVRV